MSNRPSFIATRHRVPERARYALGETRNARPEIPVVHDEGEPRSPSDPEPGEMGHMRRPAADHRGVTVSREQSRRQSRGASSPRFAAGVIAPGVVRPYGVAPACFGASHLTSTERFRTGVRFRLRRRRAPGHRTVSAHYAAEPGANRQSPSHHAIDRRLALRNAVHPNAWRQRLECGPVARLETRWIQRDDIQEIAALHGEPRQLDPPQRSRFPARSEVIRDEQEPSRVRNR